MKAPFELSRVQNLHKVISINICVININGLLNIMAHCDICDKTMLKTSLLLHCKTQKHINNMSVFMAGKFDRINEVIKKKNRLNSKAKKEKNQLIGIEYIQGPITLRFDV
ncbi:MAG: hypothetical protein COB29_11430 [Sulfitobacter sp.]|nr:MAG: hypothetical protein COB29_11430 [Sulfitobacter sp.]